MTTESESIQRLADAVAYVNEHHPLPRCGHGNALRDGGGERLLPPCGCGGERTEEFAERHVPPELFGRDHWSTLAYIETRVVDAGEFRIIGDPHMRTCRRCWRVAQAAPRPRRVAIQISNYPTRLADGRLAERHCDWDCVQDLVAAGLLKTRGEPDLKKKVTFTRRGYSVAAALRQHKAEGGSLSDFKPPEVA